MQQSINFQTARILFIREIYEKLDTQLQEINSDTKKKKKPQGEKLQQKSRCIAAIMEKLSKLQQDLQAPHFIVEEKKWCKLKSLLSAFLNNSDNPDYENEIAQLIFQIQQDKNKPIIEPFDYKAASQSAQLVDQTSLSYKLKMMEISYNDRPQGNDYYQPTTFKEKLNLNSLLPKYKMLPHSVFTSLGTDTLFYIFYYHKEPTEQNMAARELIKNQWIFNTKHGLWMKKDKHFAYKEDENEKVIKGPFLYFDYESKWQQKKKQDFQFKKKHIFQSELFQ